ncbi:beta strand repeat-containing protein [Roseobacteraceae bacterium S113]
MALFAGSRNTTNKIIGTSGNDIIVVQEGSSTDEDTLSGGDGNDLIIGDGARIHLDQSGTNNSINNAQVIDGSLYMNIEENPLVEDSTVGHTTVFGRGSGQVDYFALTVGGGETLTADIDFGKFDGVGGSDFDAVVTLYDGAGSVIATNDDPAPTGEFDIGSTQDPASLPDAITLDSLLTWTNPNSGSATVYIAVSSFGGAGVPNDATYVLNASVTNHPNAGADAAVHDADLIEGEGGNDFLIGNGGNDTIDGGADDDTIFAGSGNDVVDGGSGIDRLSYANFVAGIDVQYRTFGESTVNSASGTDTFENVEIIEMTDFDDVFTTLNAGSSSWILEAGAGDDTIFMRGNTSSEERVFGEAGNDIFKTISGSFGTHIDGGDGDDTIDGSGHNNSVGLVIDLLTQTYFFDGFSSDTNDVIDVENAIGTQDADTITGNNDANVLDGQGGADSLVGLLGNDTFIGSDGDDTLDGGFGSDLADYSGVGTGITFDVSSEQLINAVFAGNTQTLNDIENILGTGKIDTFDIDFSGVNLTASVFDGGGGADVFEMRFFDNSATTLVGGTGDDTFLGQLGYFITHIDGGQGTDTLDMRAQNARMEINLAAGTTNFTDFSDINSIQNVENVVGTGNADTITGDGEDNVIDGWSGADDIDGGAGNDTIIGSLTGDMIDGNTGVDVVDYSAVTGSGLDITMSTNSDTTVTSLSGGTTDNVTNVEHIIATAQADTLSIRQFSALNTLESLIVDAGDGADLITYGTDENTASLLDAGGGNDTIQSISGYFLGDIEGGTGTDLLDLSSANNAISFRVDLAAGETEVLNFSQNDLSAINGIEDVIGTGGNDVIVTDDANQNDIDAGDGRDLVVGSSGVDVADGGFGDDTLSFANRNERLTFELETNAFTRVTSASVDTSADNFENFVGGNLADTFDLRNTGNTGPVDISAAAGDDTVLARLGTDTLEGGTGTDTLDFSGAVAPTGVAFSLNVLGAGEARAVIPSNADFVEFSEFEVLTGTGMGDSFNIAHSLIANLSNLEANGGAGADFFLINTYAGSGAVFNGGNDNDTFSLTAGAFAGDIFGGSGIDSFDASGLSDGMNINLATQTTSFRERAQADAQTLSSIEQVFASNGADVITGNGVAALISGLAGDDTINGGVGAENLSGGDNNDKVFAGLGDFADFLDGGNGNDTLFGQEGDNTLFGGTGLDKLWGGSGDETIFGGTENDTLSGFQGDNFLDGGTGDDKIWGGNFDGFTETLQGGEGADTLGGGRGDDLMSGDENDDLIFSGNGNDTALGGAGMDTIFGNNNADLIDGGSGADSLRGDAGQDTLLGGGGADTLLGGTGSDSLIGGTQNDLLVGAIGFDVLVGGNGNDTLRGGASNDTMEGGNGDDIMNDFVGADSWVFRDIDGNDTVNGFGADDRIVMLAGTAEAQTHAEFIAASTDVGGSLVYDFGGDGLNVITITNYSVASFGFSQFDDML